MPAVINVCMQCKLTSHEGHPTEDLADAGAKVKDFFAFIHEDLTSVVVYKKSGHENAQLVSTYTLNSWPTLQPSDVCFCMMAGREVLLVAVKKENKIHVVDHANGCRFISYLDTRPLTLNKPCVLATDHTRRVWIGCEGGKIVVVDL
nr:hypothetical protein BaRGS_006114 [Batillaria attramentaria]